MDSASRHLDNLEPAEATILVVDDEPFLRELITVALSEFHTETAEDGCEAVALLQENDYDLIITDLMMPRGDGFSILHAVRELNRSAEVLVLTGYPSIENQQRCRDLGCAGFMAKPFEVMQLRSEVMDCLRKQKRARDDDSDS